MYIQARFRITSTRVRVSNKPLSTQSIKITKKGPIKLLTLPTRDEHIQHRPDSVSDISRVAGPVP